MRRILPAALGVAALLLAGCGGGGPKLAGVSGVVTVDGKPYKNAVVSFQPQGSGATENPGVGSTALTDENGKFTLTTIDGKPGAVVGRHKVRIQTKRDNPTAYFDPATGSDDNQAFDPKKQPKVDPIPTEWYADTGGKEFTVPEGGTDQANFEIESMKAAPKKK